MIASSTTDPWLAGLRPNPRARLRLCCLPHAGGGASLYRRWADLLPQDVEVCPVQLPGREGRFREPAFTRMPALTQALAQALRPCLDRPFAIFGHSMGALVGFEVARLLRRHYGLEPAHLFVSGHAAPQLPPDHVAIHALPDEAFRQELRRLNGTPQAVLDHTELMETLLPTLRADFAVCETYAYEAEAPLGCPITAFGGLQDGRVSRSGLDAWRAQTSAAFHARMLPGDHFFAHTAQPLLVEMVARDLQPRDAPDGRRSIVEPPPPSWQPPPRRLVLSRDEVHVWRASLNRPPACVRELYATLAEDERARAERYCFPKDRDHFIVGRGLLRTILGFYLGREPGRLCFCYNSQGKPALAMESSADALRFNLAHSHGLALYVVARDREVGIDLEQVRADFASEQVADRFFSPRETAALRSLPPELRLEAFFACWTRKEAYIKARGRGLSIPLDQFNVSLTPGEPAALLATRDDAGQAGRWSLRALNPAPGYLGALAVEGHSWRLWCGSWPEADHAAALAQPANGGGS